MQYVTMAAGIVVVAFTGALGGTVLVLIWKNQICLNRLLSEPNGDASLSRLQFLIFTFVIAMSLFLIVVGSDPLGFPHVPPEVLTLIGISGSSYLVSKAITFSNPASIAPPALVISPATVNAAPGAAIPVFTVSIVNAAAGTPMPALIWQLDVPTYGTIATMPPNQAQYNRPPEAPAAGTKVTIRATASGFGDGIATVEF
jgi:hypothetical protein